MSEMINCNLSNQAIFVLNDINKIKDYFNSEIQVRKIMRGKLNKYIAAFDYIDNTLIVLSATSGGVSIISFESVVGAPAGIATACRTLVFFRKTGIKKSVKKKEIKRRNIIKLLC